MSPAAVVEPTINTLQESSQSTESSPERGDLDTNRRFWDLRGVQWRTDLGVLPSSSSVDEVRRVTANSRRSYATLRRRHLIDPIPKDGSNFPDLVMDNPLSQDPDSMWGRFFQKAEIEKMVDQDLSRLYPEHGSYFQTPGCQGVLRRILLLWCIRHPNHGYRQGMHELLAPLLYVLEADVERLSAVRKLYKHYFADTFDGLSFHNTDSTYNQTSQHTDNGNEIQENQETINNLDELDPQIQTIISFCDPYGAEGELGIVLSQKFMEHDAYCMFDALMSGNGGVVAMSNFFSPPPSTTQLPPVIEASSTLYHLLAVVDSSLYTHLIELGVEPQYFALRWLRVLFGREFDLEDLLVIWDEIFAFDNNRLDGVENDPETSAGVLNSTRGAFIAALAVSMILYIRSSVLSTETATSCLQRLLNFPKDVNLGKLVKKGKSLVAVAIDAMRSMPPPVDNGSSGGGYEPSKVTTGKSHSYWEEKWRVLHKEEEKKVINKPKDWPEKMKLPLLRTESDPSSSKRYSEKTIMSPAAAAAPARLGPHVRRSLLDDLARQLGLEEEPENSSGEQSGNGGSEENSSYFSDLASPGGAANDNHQENETDRSSVASNLSVDQTEPEPEQCTVPEVAPPEVAAGEAPAKAVENVDSAGKPGTNLKDRILSSGKFQWLWKFGKNGGESSSEKGGVGGGDQKSEVAVDSVTDVTSKPESGEQIKTCSLKNLGESMVENLQVIESVFQQEKGETGQVDNLSKKALVDRGQMTAMAALKELRKISNILSEM